MSRPVGYQLSVQQVDALADMGAARTVRLRVGLADTSADAVPALIEAAARRHEVLRSTLEQSAVLKTPLQLVHDELGANWTVLGEGEDLDTAVAGAAQVDPMTGPVLTGVVAPEGHGSVVDLCASALMADVATLESLVAEATGGIAVEDPIQYSEYAAWQAEVGTDTESEDARSAAAAWGRLAAGEVGSRLPDSGAPGGLFSETVDPAHGPADDPADDPAHADDTAAHWLAVWTLTLARLTGEESVTVGVEVDPRVGNAELEGAAGPYSRIVPLTFEVPVSGSFAAFVGEVRQALGQARTWFEWSPDVPDLDVLFSAGPAGSQVERGDHQVELRALAGGGALLTVGARGSADLGARVHRAIVTLLGSGGDTIEDLDVIEASEVEARVGAAPLAGSGVSVVDRVLAHALADPDSVALTDGRRAHLTYGELAVRVQSLAAELERSAQGSGAPVGIHVPRSVDAVVAMLAAQRAGLGYVPLDVDGPPDRTLLQAGLAGVSVLVSAQPPEGWTGSVVPVDAGEPRAAGSADPVAPQALAYVMFTSGSTGVPKGVAVSQGALSGYVDGVLEVIERAAGRAGRELTWALVTGLTTDLGNTSTYGALASGGTLHVVPDELLQDPAALSAHFAESPVDVLKITPTHLRALLADPEADVLPSTVLVLGGEALTYDLARSVGTRGQCRVVNHYGPTETTVGALTHDLGPVDADSTGTVPIGRPLTGYGALVVDRRLRLVPTHAVGELLITGVGLADGYVGDDTATAAAFVTHPYHPGARAYRTGDLVRADADGVVTFLGRRDGQIKVRGYRVEPHEIELALAQHPAVRRAAVVLRHDLGAEPALVGYVVTQVNPAPSEEELKAHLGGLVPEHMVPSRLVDLDSLPLRGNGKLDVQALPVPPQQVATAFEPPNGATEKELAAIFAEALGVGAVGAHDDFFALGGHSLLATRVVVEIRGRLGVQLPVYTLFDATTVRLLAAEVDSARSEAAGGELSADELSALIAEISSMTDEEASLRLAEEGDGHTAESRPEDGA